MNAPGVYAGGVDAGSQAAAAAGRPEGSDARRDDNVRGVGGLVVEADVPPGVQGDLQRLAGLGRLGQDLLALADEIAALVAGLDHCLGGHPVGGGARRDAHRVADRPAADSIYNISLKDIDGKLTSLKSYE